MLKLSNQLSVFLCLYIMVSESGKLNALNNALIITSACICPGFNLIYECVVKGTDAGFTVWRGSAFNCASNDIILHHMRFTSVEGALGECNEGSIVGRSLGLEAGSFYVSQLSVRVSPEVIGKSIDCVLDDTDATFRLIGSAAVNITTDPFLPPGEVSISLTNLGSKQLTFSWSPVAAECPTIHYNILASNCGSCPTATNYTNVTCTEVPIEQKTLCTFALQTVVCGNIPGVLSNPISVAFSDSNSMHGSIDNGSSQAVNSCSNGFLVALVSVIVLLAICVAVLIIVLIKTKKRLQTTTVKYKAASESESKPASANLTVDTRKNIAYEPNPVAVEARKNVAYKPIPAAVDTKKNVAYESNTVTIGNNS